MRIEKEIITIIVMTERERSVLESVLTMTSGIVSTFRLGAYFSEQREVYEQISQLQDAVSVLLTNPDIRYKG